MLETGTQSCPNSIRKSGRRKNIIRKRQGSKKRAKKCCYCRAGRICNGYVETTIVY